MVRPLKEESKKILASETGTILKDSRGRTGVALVYPNIYSVGMANLGFQTLYGLLNQWDHLFCERAFLSPKEVDSPGYVPKTLESKRLLSEFDVIAFSISFENDYPNLLSILEKINIPLLSKQRTHRHPVIMAGGVACFINPEPISDFIDCFIIGEAEPVVGDIFEVFDPKNDRISNLKNLAKEVQGVYVPAFYETTGDKAQTVQSLWPSLPDVPPIIKRVFVQDLAEISTTSTIVTPHTSFGRTFLIETGRGCPHGCRFCTAGYVYRPLRFRKLDQLSQSLDEGALISTRIGLIGAAVTDLPDLKPLCEHVKDKNLRVSFSSLRADRLSEAVISVLQQNQTKTATIAPDAGSERMRQVIKKGICEEDILGATEKLVAAGIPNLKLYFMVGLPTETWDDVEGIILLCKKIKQVFLTSSRIQRHIGSITVSLNAFVPKPFTPFQWAGMDDMKTAKKKIKFIRNKLQSVPNMRLIAESPRRSYVQGLLSRGDRRIGALLLKLLKNNHDWAKTLKDNPIISENDVLRTRSKDEPLPWQFIDQGYDMSFLRKEYEKALTQGF